MCIRTRLKEGIVYSSRGFSRSRRENIAGAIGGERRISRGPAGVRRSRYVRVRVRVRVRVLVRVLVRVRVCVRMRVRVRRTTTVTVATVLRGPGLDGGRFRNWLSMFLSSVRFQRKRWMC